MPLKLAQPLDLYAPLDRSVKAIPKMEQSKIRVEICRENRRSLPKDRLQDAKTGGCHIRRIVNEPRKSRGMIPCGG